MDVLFSATELFTLRRRIKIGMEGEEVRDKAIKNGRLRVSFPFL